MSRGPGAAERGVLAALARYGPMNATELAQDLFGLWGTLKLEPTAAQLGTVRRAIRHLAARGVIVEYYRGSRRKYWQFPDPEKREGRRERSRAPQERRGGSYSCPRRQVHKAPQHIGSEHAGEPPMPSPRPSGCANSTASPGATSSIQRSPDRHKNGPTDLHRGRRSASKRASFFWMTGLGCGSVTRLAPAAMASSVSCRGWGTNAWWWRR